MPISKTQNVGKTMEFLKKDKPGMPQKQKVAIALSVAREAGAKMPMKKEMPMKKDMSPKKKWMMTSDGKMKA